MQFRIKINDNIIRILVSLFLIQILYITITKVVVIISRFRLIISYDIPIVEYDSLQLRIKRNATNFIFKAWLDSSVAGV